MIEDFLYNGVFQVLVLVVVLVVALIVVKKTSYGWV